MLIELILSLPKTIFFNLKYFKLRGLRFPFLIHYKTKFGKLDGKISIPKDAKLGEIKIGFSRSFALGGSQYIENRGNLIFDGKATFSRGTQIVINKDATLEFGKKFSCNANCIFNAGRKIVFGDDCMIAWGVTVLDGDGHLIYDVVSDERCNCDREINVGSHVWICPDASILKGAKIQSDTVIATKSVITKEIKEKNVLVGNNVVLKKGINWRH